MGFLDKVLGIATKIGGIAGKYASKTGIIGKIAGGINKAAKLVTTILPKAVPIVNKVIGVGKMLYKSGVLDKLTGGKATRFVKGVRNLFSPQKGIKQDVASAVQQAGAQTGTAQMAQIM